jgi:predicted O-methyltransferase YrrM
MLFSMTASATQAPRISRPDQRDVLTLVQQLKLTGTFAEVGTFGGHFAYDVMAVCNPQKLYCVDPYAVYDGFKDALNNNKLDAVFEEAKQRLSPFGDKVEFLRMYSEEAAKQIPDNSLDFVYIDGNHAYKYALQDFECWFPKVRDGGLICGDDATDTEDDSTRNDEGDVVRVWTRNAVGEPESWGHYGVLKAAKEFTDKRGIKLFQVGSQCAIFKGRDISIG